MIKVIGSVVDSKLNLIGLTIQGKASEFGVLEAPSSLVTKNMYLTDLAKMSFKSSMLSVVNKDGKATVVYNNGTSSKLRELPMQMLTSQGLVPINNKASVEAIRYNGTATNDNAIGYVLKIQDNNIAIKRDDIVPISELFDLDFKVAYDSKGRPYILGKAHGRKKESLKAEIVNLVNPVYSRKNPAVTGTDIKMDFISIMKLAQECGALVVISNGKVHMNEMLVKTSTMAKPNLKFTLKNLNVNIVGTMSGHVVVDDVAYAVKAFRTVNIIKNGKVGIKELKIAIKKSCFSSFIGRVGSSVSFVDYTSEIKEADKIELTSRFDGEDFIVLSMNIEDVPLFTGTNASKYVLNQKELDSTLESLNTARICKTILTDKSGALPLLAELQGVRNPADRGQTIVGARETIESDIFDRSEILEQFRDFSAKKLLRLINSGINVYTGFYEAPNYRADKDNTIIEIEYTNRYSKLTGFSKINDALINNDTVHIPSGVTSLIAQLAIHKDTKLMFEKLQQYEVEYTAAVTKLALHKLAMCELTGYTVIHSHDAEDWEVTTKYRGQGTKYLNTKSKDGLACVSKNISIR